MRLVIDFMIKGFRLRAVLLFLGIDLLGVVEARLNFSCISRRDSSLYSRTSYPMNCN